jgi:hypothetical protein
VGSRLLEADRKETMWRDQGWAAGWHLPRCIIAGLHLPWAARIALHCMQRCATNATSNDVFINTQTRRQGLAPTQQTVPVREKVGENRLPP